MSVIRLNEALKIMESGEIFSIIYVSYDKRRKTGGRLIEYLEAKISKTEKTPATGNSSGLKKEGLLKVNPNHWKNYTRNLILSVNGIETGTIRKAHIWLILQINGKKVFL